MTEYYRTYFSQDVTKAFGLSQRQAIYLSERMIVGALVEAEGMGTRRIYSYYHMLEFGLVAEFMALGFKIERIKKFLATLRGEGFFEEWARGWWSDFYNLKNVIEFIEKKKKAPILVNDGELTWIGNEVPRKHYGVLIWTGSNDSGKLLLIPFTISTALAIVKFLVGTEIGDFRSLFMVNLGAIQHKLDVRANPRILMVR